MNQQKLPSYEKSRDVNVLEERRMTVYNATINTRQSAYNRYSSRVMPVLKMAVGSATHANSELNQKPAEPNIPAENVQVVRLVGELSQQQELERAEREAMANNATNQAYDSVKYELTA